MMNWVWLGLIVASILFAGFTGNMQEITNASLDSTKEAVWFSFKLVGVMTLWLGIMQVAQDGGMLRIIARWLRRPMRWLFPDIPEEHPAMSAMILNFAANMMGLANAATPFGIKAMIELNKLNQHKGIATDAMCLFLAINTSGLALLPTGVMNVRRMSGSQDPASIWLPTLLATLASTLVGVVVAKLLQRARRYRIEHMLAGVETDKTPDQAPAAGRPAGEDVSKESLPALGGMERPGPAVRVFIWLVVAAFVASVVYHYGFQVEDMGLGAGIQDFFSSWGIPTLMGGLLLFGLSRRVRVYESLVEGGREGFRVAVMIIPYLVAIFVAVAMFEAAGAMESLKQTVGKATAWLGMPVEALPMTILRPLSGTGSFAYMGSIFENPSLGPDSFVGQMVSVMQGSTETTLYVLAVYFGAVQVYRVRHALAAGLCADLMGIVAAVGLSHLFF